MKTNNNKLPVIKADLVADTKQFFCIQKIVKYDDCEESLYCDYIGIYDSAEGEIDKDIQRILKNEKDFFNTHKITCSITFTIRKVAIKCDISVIKQDVEYFENTYAPLYCTECGRPIRYGDDYISDNNGNLFCSSDCFANNQSVVFHNCNDEGNYDKAFIKKI